MWAKMGTRGRTAADAAVALTAGAFTIVMLSEGGLGTAEPGYRALDLLGVGLTVATAAPLLFARRFPGFAWGVVALASLLLIVSNYGLDVPPGPLIAACVLAEAVGGGETPRRRLVAAVSVAAYLPVAFILMALAGKSIADMSSGLFAWAVMFALVWIAGDRSRLRHERIVELEERARLREQEMAAQRRAAAAEERTLIARELHDSAGHAINVILVQAGAARLLHERDPERSRRAIETIEEVAHSTIADIDRLVRALRTAPTDASPAPATVANATPHNASPLSTNPHNPSPHSSNSRGAVPSGATPASMTPSGMAPSGTAPGCTATSSTVPSNTTPSSTTLSSTAQSGAMPDAVMPGTVIPGTTRPGTAMSGTARPGTAMSGTARPGTAMRGGTTPTGTTPGDLVAGAGTRAGRACRAVDRDDTTLGAATWADVIPADPAPADTAALEQLVDRHRASGLRVAATFHGAPRGLPSGVAWAAYRILQEALTNAARHGSGSAEVRMSYGPAAVDIVVSNPVGDQTRPGGGMGIIGMKERAALLDGTLDADPEDAGTFRLRARLPYVAPVAMETPA
ncbi:histidine kinase [Actinoplanes sp. NEAU-A12]|uniref:histidine kinase n=1 Tax=Actinoplanes sandaracinus TaxID=3045177 RepID=A0ABT6WR05_9ACTN|nr:histidine kinase [Actinoplanes sandaracinus]MDI6102168.1 histidine kinase [Actinoplanes sandaracinus]